MAFKNKFPEKKGHFLCEKDTNISRTTEKRQTGSRTTGASFHISEGFSGLPFPGKRRISHESKDLMELSRPRPSPAVGLKAQPWTNVLLPPSLPFQHSASRQNRDAGYPMRAGGCRCALELCDLLRVPYLSSTPNKPTIALLTDVEAEAQGDAHTAVTSFQSQATGRAACIEAGVVWRSSKQGHPWVPCSVGSKPFKPWTQREPLVCRSQGSVSEAENHPTCKVGKFSSPSGTGGLL